MMVVSVFLSTILRPVPPLMSMTTFTSKWLVIVLLKPVPSLKLISTRAMILSILLGRVPNHSKTLLLSRITWLYKMLIVHLTIITRFTFLQERAQKRHVPLNQTLSRSLLKYQIKKVLYILFYILKSFLCLSPLFVFSRFI